MGSAASYHIKSGKTEEQYEQEQATLKEDEAKAQQQPQSTEVPTTPAGGAQQPPPTQQQPAPHGAAPSADYYKSSRRGGKAKVEQQAAQRTAEDLEALRESTPRAKQTSRFHFRKIFSRMQSASGGPEPEGNEYPVPSGAGAPAAWLRTNDPLEKLGLPQKALTKAEVESAIVRKREFARRAKDPALMKDIAMSEHLLLNYQSAYFRGIDGAPEWKRSLWLSIAPESVMRLQEHQQTAMFALGMVGACLYAWWLVRYLKGVAFSGGRHM